jgi:anti-sigma regulatory factor (Ser/Thr protein kinase)
MAPAEIPNVRLTLASNPTSVALVRQAVSGVAEVIGLDALELNEVNIAVSEAANNVVLHAYGSGEGPLEVDLRGRRGGLFVAVRDRGRGIGAGADGAMGMEAPAGIGLGLPVIQALARAVQVNAIADGGTEVRMEFDAAHPHALREPPHADGLAAAVPAATPPPGTASLAVAPTRLARAVVPRVVSALAAHARFTTDRIADTRLLADLLVAHTDDSLSASHLNLQAAAVPHELRLRVGPLHAGHAGALIHDAGIDGLGVLLAQLADGHRIEDHAGPSEMISLRLAARR